MSGSDSEEFASADEEVNENELRSSPAEGKEGHAKQKEVRKKVKVDSCPETPQESEDSALMPQASAIQRQPCGGFLNTDEETKDPRKALDSLAAKKTEGAAAGGGGWGFGGWGSSLLSTARSSVSTLTTQLGDGFNTVMETVESALDVPPPEELHKEAPAEEKEENAEETKTKETADGTKEDKTDGGWWNAGWEVTSSVVTSGRSLMTGGLDVLETIGKKTMEVLHETDPGLSRTRSLLRSGRAPGTSLSQALREARQRHEEDCLREERWEEERLGHFGAQFEDCQGMAHLEALEMLSSQCEARLHSQLNRLSGDDLSTRKRQLMEIKRHFEKVEEEEEEEEESEEERKPSAEVWKEVKATLRGFQLPAAQEVLRVHEEKSKRLEDSVMSESDQAEGNEDSEKVLQSLNQSGVQLLALISSAWVGLFHKAGELAMAGGLRLTEEEGDDDAVDAVAAAERLVKCADVASQDISCLGEDVADLLRKNSGEEQRRLSTQLVTGIYLETGNSRAYVRDAFLLLLPVLQLAALN